MNYPHTLKASIPLLIFLAVFNTAFSQSVQREVEIIQEVFGQNKQEAVASFMDLGDDAERFWSIYDEYEAERKELGQERIQIIVDYALSYPTISDEEILALFNRTKSYKKSFAKLQKKYFNRMRKEVGASAAAQFWQLESYITAIVQEEIYSQIPFIGDNLNGN